MRWTGIYRNFFWLNNKYTNKKLSIVAISKICKANPSTIFENLVRLKIPRRKRGPINQTEAAKIKISKSLIGRKPMLGKTHSKETKELMAKKRTGAGNSNWKGGVTVKGRKFRKSKPYQIWRNFCLERDDHNCQFEGCGVKTNIVHHIKPAIEFPELKLDLTNGMTICLEHHKLIHKQLRNGKQQN